MDRAVDMSTATPTLQLKASDWTYGDHILKVRSWFGTLSYDDISLEFEAMSQSLAALLKTRGLCVSFLGWKMLMINCWKLIVISF